MTELESLELKMTEILRSSLARTVEGVMKWRTTDDEDAFTYSGVSTSLVIDLWPESGKIQLRVLNARGTVVATLESTPPGPLDEDVRSKRYSMLVSMHDAARRNALNIDGVLTAALEELAALDEPPF